MIRATPYSVVVDDSNASNFTHDEDLRIGMLALESLSALYLKTLYINPILQMTEKSTAVQHNCPQNDTYG
jgi:hypothetical protein